MIAPSASAFVPLEAITVFRAALNAVPLKVCELASEAFPIIASEPPAIVKAEVDGTMLFAGEVAWLKSKTNCPALIRVLPL